MSGKTQPVIETKIVDVEFKLYNTDNVTDKLPDGTGGFQGYALAFGNVDSYNDIIEKGASLNCIPDLVHHGFFAVNHDWYSLSVATIEEAKEDNYGLWIRGEYFDTQHSQDTRIVMATRLKKNHSVRLSIGYEVIAFTIRPDGVRVLTEIYIHEVSYVNVPANGKAIIQDVKTMLGDIKPANIDALLDGLTNEDEAASVLATVSSYARRIKSIQALRIQRKAGRVISQSNMTRIENILVKLNEAVDECEALLASTTVDTEPTLQLLSADDAPVEIKSEEPIETSESPVTETPETKTETTETTEEIPTEISESETEKQRLLKLKNDLHQRFLENKFKHSKSLITIR